MVMGGHVVLFKLPSRQIFFYLTYFLYICLQTILKLLMTGESGNKRAGIMIPIPQYPLYTATIAEYNAYPVSSFTKTNMHVPYFIVETNTNFGL